MSQHARKHFGPLQAFTALVLVVMLCGPASALRLADHIAPNTIDDWTVRWVVKNDKSEWLLYRRDGVTGSVTLRSAFTVAQMGSSSGLEGITLAGLSEAPGDSGDELALVWAPSPSNWFGTVWSLQLHSSVGIDQRGKRVKFVELATVMPTVGHEYVAHLSVDAASGTVAISVVDVTDGKGLYHGTQQVYGVGNTSLPVVGLSSNKVLAIKEGGMLADPPVVFGEAGVAAGYIPVGAEFAVGTPTGSGAVIPVQRFDFSETVGMRLTGLEGVNESSLRLSLIDARGHVHPLDAQQLVTEGFSQLPASELPMGAGRLRLEYVGPGGSVLLAGERALAIGTVRFHFTEVVADKDQGVLRGAATVTGVGGSAELGVILEAVLERATWSETERIYITQPVAKQVLVNRTVKADQEGERITFTMPLPEEPGAWVVRLEPSTHVGAGVENVGVRERWFTTYAAADLVPGQPFTVAILPDTQLYTWSHPHIFMRQTEWLASRAQERNIGMVLHLGDVTEMNLRREWESADQSMGMLDGVIPYAATVGNHDIIDGSYSVYNRSGTLFHEFFPPERFAALAGTFEPGRAENSYHLVELAGVPYLFLMIEYAPRDEVLEWANDVVASYPDRTVIVVTHTYLASSGSARISPFSSSDYPQKSPLASIPGETLNDGDQIWDKFVRWHPNVLMVWSGHIPTTTIRSRISAGQAFNPVYEFLADYQGESLGGSGWLVLLEFTPDGTVTARTYSPYLGVYNTAVDAYGFTNHVVIDVASGRVQRIAD